MQAAQIPERRALLIARTEINRAYRQSNWNQMRSGSPVKRDLSQRIRLTNVILISYFVLLTLDFLVFYCYYKSINENGIRVPATVT